MISNSLLARRQRGIALPVMLIMLVVMLVGSVYMMKVSNTSTLTTASMAYEATMTRAADYGIVTASAWLKSVVEKNDRKSLEGDTAGYVATWNPAVPVSSPAYWQGSVVITDETDRKNKIEYVIHRLCTSVGKYDWTATAGNACVATTAVKTLNGKMEAGKSMAIDAPEYFPPPKIHYVITSRIFGARGGNVINQAIVMIGA